MISTTTSTIQWKSDMRVAAKLKRICNHAEAMPERAPGIPPIPTALSRSCRMRNAATRYGNRSVPLRQAIHGLKVIRALR